jgi:hypothetical protein
MHEMDCGGLFFSSSPEAFANAQFDSVPGQRPQCPVHLDHVCTRTQMDMSNPGQRIGGMLIPLTGSRFGTLSMPPKRLPAKVARSLRREIAETRKYCSFTSRLPSVLD